MRVRIILLAGVAAALMACSPPAQQQADAGGAGGGGAASPTSIQPGQYRSTMTILEMNIPGAPAQQLNMEPFTTESCVTATDISEMTRDQLVENEDGVTCTQNSMNSANGRIEGESTCQTPHGTQTMHMSGTYTPTHVEMEVSSSSAMPGGRGNMTQRMRIVTDRIGDCTADAG